MELPVSIFLIPYAILVLMFIIFGLVHVWHLYKFMILEAMPLFVVIFFVVVSILILSISFRYLIVIDWNQTIVLFGSNIL